MSETGGGQCFNGILGCRCKQALLCSIPCRISFLIKDGYKVGTHKGAMLMFGQHYVRTGIFTADASSLYIKLQTMREKSDYNCVYVTTAEEMQPLFEPVREFIAKVGNLIKE